MQGGERWMKVVASGLVAAMLVGCASLDDYRRLQAAHRSLKAEKEALQQELFDARNVNDSLRTRVQSLDQQLATKEELLRNLRSENELLAEMRQKAETALEELANRQRLGDIKLAGPALPPPLDSALKQFADQHAGLVEYDPARGTVKWKSDLLFPLGSDVVKESSRKALQEFADIVKSAAAEDFETLVVGHTDNRPIVRPETKSKHPTNWHLSAHRAIAVAFQLAEAGYPPERIGIMGCGEYRPVADNATEDGAAKNRRVEIYLIPRGSIVPGATSASAKAAHPEPGSGAPGK
ncbi:MAG: hypothetical protein D6788_02035 [Planctomycetota bacterium]|nr:MAG: hypothetical protein D6788_02035 [Planctomycetota bacterium]